MQPFRRSVFITFFSTNANAAVQFGITLVLARLLSPSEIGIFSITVMVTNIAAIFRDFGVTPYIKREKELTPDKIRSALGFMVTSSWAIALLIFVGSNYVADFYNEPGIGKVMRVLSLSFVVVPFASFYYALLSRDLEAGKQAVVNGVGTIAYAVSCLSLAWAGFSYLSMAWANLINICSTIVVYVLLRPAHAKLRLGFRHWGEIARFGSGTIAAGVVDRVNAAIPDLVLGKLSGPHDVGLYSRAGGLIGIFSQVAGPTLHYNVLPFLARNHHEGKPLWPLLQRGVSYLTVVAWPVFMVIALFPAEIIGILYGDKWLEAAPIASVLAIASMVIIGTTFTQPGLLAIGRPFFAASNPVASVLFRLVLIFLLPSSDVLHFAMAICLADILAVGMSFWMMSAHLGFTLKMAAKSYWLSARVCLPCAALALAFRFGLPAEWPALLKLVVLGVPMMAMWLWLLFATRHPLASEMLPLLKRFLPVSLTPWFERRAGALDR